MVSGTFFCRIGLVGVVLAGVAAAQAPQLRPFSHKDHVRQSWLGSAEEWKRDCRGCHDYDADPAARARPSDRCDRCHGYQKPSYDGAPPTSEPTGAGAGHEPFPHHEHRTLDCRRCHEPAGTEVPASLPVPGSAACMDCHGRAGEAARARVRLEDGLDVRLARRDAVGVFRHDQHVRPATFSSEDPSACRTCHFGVEESDQETLGDNQFSAQRCESCHPGIGFQTESYEKPSRTAATFVHRPHLSANASAKNAELASKRCFACHSPGATREHFDLGERFRVGQELHVYDGCVTCHADRHVAGHGSIADCRRCHDFDSRGLGGLVEVWKARRARVEVTRAQPLTFSFGVQGHPFVTAAPEATCESCHKARLPGLPSRLDGKAFRHDTHLSQPATEGECRACHTSLPTAGGPAELTVAAAVDAGASGAAPLFTLEACASCHAAKALRVNPADAQARSVLRFAHAEHVGRVGYGRSEPLECGDCHVRTEARIELAPHVSECAPCHTHARPDTTLGHAQGDIESCAFCHTRGVPERSEPAPVPRLKLARVVGRRRHPRALDKDCTECHAPSVAEPPLSPPIDLRMSVTLRNPHASPELSKSPEKHFETVHVTNRTSLCVDCHWAIPGSIKKEEALIHRQKEWGNDPELTWRRNLGNTLDAGFPGIPWPSTAPVRR